jgi:hypothetical protein
MLLKNLGKEFNVLFLYRKVECQRSYYMTVNMLIIIIG